MWNILRRSHTKNLPQKSTSFFKSSPKINQASLHINIKKEGDIFSMYTVAPSTFWNNRHVKEALPAPFPPSKKFNKTMKDSYVEKYLPFKSDPYFLDEWVSVNGRIRIGKILEELDKIAGASTLKHIENVTPVSFVTASFDRFDLFLPVTGDKDCILSAYIDYTGKSSAEVQVKAETVPEKGEEKQTVLTATVFAVGVDPVTQKPTPVNHIMPTSPKEEALFKSRAASIQEKKQMQLQSNNPEQYARDYNRLINNVYAKGSANNIVFMGETAIDSTFLMVPQDRNLNDKVFGGYLMRRAYELAYANTSLLLKSYPRFVSMEEASFLKPISIGTILNMKSMVVLSEEGSNGPTMQIRVVAESTDVDTGLKQTTNVLYFTFASEKEAQVPTVIPKTDEEKRHWVDAHRRRENGILERRLSLKNSKY